MNLFFKSFGYALQGIVSALKEQRNLKVQLVLGLVAIAMGLYYEIRPWEWTAVCLSIGLVLGLEMMNSAIEALVDLVTVERKPLPGKIKDIAAGGVLLASIVAAVVGVIVFSQYIF
ncbi:MAG: diacylglycerol kinase family protein [Bacteroidota bacterium]